MISRTSILQCLPLLANALGRSYGVHVEVGGNRACTDGRVIRLPDLPAAADNDFLELVRGYIDHESAHIRHTDFDCLSGASPLEKHVWNIFEDRRVEQRLAALFPGCGRNFSRLIRRMFLKPSDDTDTANDPASSILNWLLLTVRSWDVPELERRCRESAGIMDGHWPGLRPALESILQSVRASCPDSAACMRYAKAVVEHLRGVTQAPPVLPKSGSQNPVNPGAVESKIANSELEQKSADEAETARQSLERLLNAPESELPDDLGQCLSRSLETQAGNVPERVHVAVVQPKALKPLAPDDRTMARKATMGMRTRFHALLQSTRQVRGLPSHHGRLNTRNMYQVLTGNPRVFLRFTPKPALNTAVHLLLDCSGSMRRRISLATCVCHAVAQALELVGVNVGVTAFPGERWLGDAGHRCPRCWSTANGSMTGFTSQPRASHPMGEALWWVVGQMVPLREKRKLILIITDGEPDNRPGVQQAIEAGSHLGFEFHGLGIKADSIRRLLPQSSVNITSLTELAPAMFSMLGNALASNQNLKTRS